MSEACIPCGSQQSQDRNIIVGLPKSTVLSQLDVERIYALRKQQHENNSIKTGDGFVYRSYENRR